MALQDIFSKLFREIEQEIGTAALDKLVLDALAESINKFKIINREEFQNEFKEILEAVKNTEPRISIIIEHILSIYEELPFLMQKKPEKEITEEEIKSALLRKYKKILQEKAENKKALLKHALEKINIEGKNVLIFDHSHTVMDVLNHLHNHGQKFKVIVAEQEKHKTEENIAALHRANIEFEVIPAYMLSHYEQQVDVLFFGCVTMKSTYDFVVDPGSLAIISEFHINRKPIYMFTTTAKFALWKATKRTEVFAHPHTRKHPREEFEYRRLKFSHDRVPAKLFEKIITEEGVFSYNKLKLVFDRKFTEHHQRKSAL